MSFSQFDFHPELLQGLTEMGFENPTPIQAQTIPLLLDNQDIIGLAQTGTGKTAAFALPIIQRIKPGSKHPQALIVTPTRELAEQIVTAIDQYCQFMPIKALAVYGGISARAQERALQQGVDIVVATPGRLIDHLQNSVIRLYNVKYLVLDEADRMLDMGFIPDIETMMTYLPKDRQTLLFSATMPPQVEHLAQSLTQNATTIEAGVRSQAAKTVTQRLFKVAQTRKLELLLELLAEDVVDSVIVFSQTKHGADRITRDLIGAGISATCIHSNYTQTQRQKSLDGFKKGDYSVMVATDIAARGIDIPAVSHVINFDTPQHAEDYVHRIGRTGRASSEGVALTFTSRNELKYLKNIEDLIGSNIELADEKNAAASAYPASQTPSETPAEPETPAVTETLAKTKPASKKPAASSEAPQIEAAPEKPAKSSRSASTKRTKKLTEPVLEAVSLEAPIEKDEVKVSSSRPARGRGRKANAKKASDTEMEVQASEAAPEIEAEPRRSSRKRPGKAPKKAELAETIEIKESEPQAKPRQAPQSSYERRRAQANQKREQVSDNDNSTQITLDKTNQNAEPQLDRDDETNPDQKKRSGRSRSRRSRRNKSDAVSQQALESQSEVPASEEENQSESRSQRQSSRRNNRNRSQSTQTEEPRQERESRQEREPRQERESRQEREPRQEHESRQEREPRQGRESRQEREPRQGRESHQEREPQQQDRESRPEREPRNRRGRGNDRQADRPEQTARRDQRDDGRSRQNEKASELTEPIAEGNEAVRPPENLQLPKKQRSSRRQQADAIQNKETYTSAFYRNESDVDYLESDERQPDYVDANVWSYPMKQPYHQAQQRGGGNRSGGGGNRSVGGENRSSGNSANRSTPSSSGNRRSGSNNANSSSGGGGNRSRRRR